MEPLAFCGLPLRKRGEIPDELVLLRFVHRGLPIGKNIHRITAKNQLNGILICVYSTRLMTLHGWTLVNPLDVLIVVKEESSRTFVLLPSGRIASFMNHSFVRWNMRSLSSTASRSSGEISAFKQT